MSPEALSIRCSHHEIRLDTPEISAKDVAACGFDHVGSVYQQLVLIFPRYSQYYLIAKS
jgi:hypothetical protein